MRNWRPWPRACWYQYTDRCPGSGEHLSIACCFLDLIRYLGVWVTSESTRPVGEKTRKLRAEHREASCCSPLHQASISGRQRHLRNSHTVSRTHLLPGGRQSHSRGAWSPWQHQEPRIAAGWGRGSWGEWCKVLTLLFPDWSICL